MATKILYMEDEPDLCEFVKLKLEATGEFSVSTSTTAQGGEDWVSREKPEIILLDVVMPERSGWDLAKQLKRKDSPHRRIPIILISGKGEMIFQKKTGEFKWQPNHPLVKNREKLPDAKGAEALAQAYGVDDFINKPFKIELVIEVIKEVFERTRKKTKEEEGGDEVIV